MLASSTPQRVHVACQKPNATRPRSCTIVRASSQPQQHIASTAAASLIATTLLPSAAHADALVGSEVGLAVGGGAAIAALGAALVATDPQKRRSAQMSETGGDEKEAVRNYFNTAGFERWNKIYGETDQVNKVQLDIREGHAQTVEKVLAWLRQEGGVRGVTVADCGCGTGSLAIPLALQGARVSGSDISDAMVQEASRRFDAAAKGSKDAVAPEWQAADLESVGGVS